MTIVHQQYPIWKGLGSLANRRSSPLKIFRSRENRDWGYCMLSVPASFFLVYHSLTLSAHAQQGLQYLVCVSVCLSFTTLSKTILALQATRRFMSNTNSFSATKA